MKAKHTPGPWNMAGHTFSYVIGTNGIRVASTFNITTEGHGGVMEEEANAHLIAAAPDLLAALEELATLPNKHRPESVWEAARAAIAKAKGKP